MRITPFLVPTARVVRSLSKNMQDSPSSGFPSVPTMITFFASELNKSYLASYNQPLRSLPIAWCRWTSSGLQSPVHRSPEQLPPSCHSSPSRRYYLCEASTLQWFGLCRHRSNYSQLHSRGDTALIRIVVLGVDCLDVANLKLGEGHWMRSDVCNLFGDVLNIKEGESFELLAFVGLSWLILILDHKYYYIAANPTALVNTQIHHQSL